MRVHGRWVDTDREGAGRDEMDVVMDSCLRGVAAQVQSEASVLWWNNVDVGSGVQ